jgi:predicted ATPase
MMTKTLRIRNFKAFRDQPLEFSALTLLAGLNGSGKSSVLQALLVLRQSFDQNLLQSGQVALDGNLVRIGTFHDALFESAGNNNLGFELTLRHDGVDYPFSWSFEFTSPEDRLSKRPPVTPSRPLINA